jgi:hypothetical protein
MSIVMYQPIITSGNQDKEKSISLVVTSSMRYGILVVVFTDKNGKTQIVVEEQELLSRYSV